VLNKEGKEQKGKKRKERKRWRVEEWKEKNGGKWRGKRDAD
jgi:hypothetical protein